MKYDIVNLAVCIQFYTLKLFNLTKYRSKCAKFDFSEIKYTIYL